MAAAADFTMKQLNKAFDLKSAKQQSANEEGERC